VARRLGAQRLRHHRHPLLRRCWLVGKIVEMDFLADRERLAALDLTLLNR
jgi:hypothetical protein